MALGIARPDLLELPVLLVAREVLDEAFGREQLLFSLPDPGVDVRGGPAVVGDGLDRAEVELATRACQEASISLKVCVERVAVPCVLQLEVGAVPVALPDLDDGVAERVPPWRQGGGR